MRTVSFRPLLRSDFPQLGTWLETPHVARWWNHDAAPEALERDFGPSLDGIDPAEVFIALAEGEPCGFLQRYSYADNKAYLEHVRTIIDVPAHAFSIDYFIGESYMLRQGWGTAMLRAGVDAVWRDEPSVPSVIVPVSAANVASMRVLERAGFHVAGRGALDPDNPIDGVDHVVYRIERPRR